MMPPRTGECQGLDLISSICPMDVTVVVLALWVSPCCRALDVCPAGFGMHRPHDLRAVLL
jgi:hypothetical protein